LSRIFALFLLLSLLLTPVQSKASTGVFINELAWMGTEESSHNEWIELYNSSTTTISLNGWVLEVGNNKIILQGEIRPNSFYLLERTDDKTLPNVKADQIYSGSLQNEGEKLILTNRNKNVIDKIDCREGWFKGNNDSKRTMERKGNAWQSSNKPGGTPKGENSKGFSKEKKNYIDLTLADSSSIRYKNFTLVFLISLITALFSAIIVLLIDKEINKI